MISYRYGNVYLQLAKTQQLSFVMERDPYEVDALWTCYDIRIRGFLATSEGLLPGVNGQTAITAKTLNQVKKILETPRLSMEYRIAGETVVKTNGMDAKIGPEPHPCVITEVTSGTFWVECGCKVRVVECDTDCPCDRSPVVSLRWTQSESFDENWYSHLRTQGHLIVRSDLLKSADNFRPLATPPILTDYVRQSSKYTLSPDGTQLDFEFDDLEHDRLPPYPATKAQGTYVVNIQRPGSFRIGTVHIRLEGQKGTSRKSLLVKAVAMAYSKLANDQILTDKSGKPTNIIWGRFQEGMLDPTIEIEMSAMLAPVGSALGLIGKTVGSPGSKQAADIIDTVGSATLPYTGPFGYLLKLAAEAKVEAAAAPVARGGGAALDAEAFVTNVMPSVGMNTYGLASGQPGIAPPSRKRLAGLLVALFRDPCLCDATEGVLRSGVPPGVFSESGPPSNARNSKMLTGELSTNPPAAGVATISIGPTVNGNALSLIGAAIGNLQDVAPYDNYEVETETQWETGGVLMPGTGVGALGAIGTVVNAHGGYMRVTTTWVAGRTGKPPQLPSFLSLDPNLVPLKGRIVAKEVQPSADGASMRFLTAGYYVHAVKNPSLQQIAPAVPPQYSNTVREAAAQGSSFFSNLVTWQRSEGGGLYPTTYANPFVDGGTQTAPTPVTPPAYNNPQTGTVGTGLATIGDAISGAPIAGKNTIVTDSADPCGGPKMAAGNGLGSIGSSLPTAAGNGLGSIGAAIGGGFDLSLFNAAELAVISSTGKYYPPGQVPGVDYFYNPPKYGQLKTNPGGGSFYTPPANP